MVKINYQLGAIDKNGSSVRIGKKNNLIYPAESMTDRSVYDVTSPAK